MSGIESVQGTVMSKEIAKIFEKPNVPFERMLPKVGIPNENMKEIEQNFEQPQPVSSTQLMKRRESITDQSKVLLQRRASIISQTKQVLKNTQQVSNTSLEA